MEEYKPNANSVIHNVQASLDRRGVPDIVHLVQYDRTLPILAVELTYGDQPFAVPADAEVNVRLRKPDGTHVYDPALGTSEDRRTVYIGVTAQMTAAAGRVTATLEILEGGGVVGTAPILFDVDVNPVPEDAIESSDEYLTLQDLAAQAAASAAAAKASETEAGKSKTAAAASASQAAASAAAAGKSETAAKGSADAAKDSQDAAATSAANAKRSEDAAAESKTAAGNSATAAKTSETNAKSSADAAAASQTAAKTSETNAKTSENTAKTYQTEAANSATAASGSAAAAAQSAETAKQYSGKPPEIDENGFWETWDADAQKYTSTGEKAVNHWDKTYKTVAEMQADKTQPKNTVCIISSDVEQEENAQVYMWDGAKWNFLCDLSGLQGVGIAKIELTAGNHAPGTDDTYTVTLTDRRTYTFSVHNGSESPVLSVNGRTGDVTVQETLAGTQGQVAGFDSEGKAAAAEVGGRNLIKSSSPSIQTTDWKAFGANDDLPIVDGYAVSEGWQGNYLSVCSPYEEILLPPGDYTCSLTAVMENAESVDQSALVINFDLLNPLATGLGRITKMSSQETTYHCTFHLDHAIDGQYRVALMIYTHMDYPGAEQYRQLKLRAKDFKIERGSVATDWSPAPEDIQEKLNGSQGQVVGFDKDGNAVTGAISGRNFILKSGVSRTSSEGFPSVGNYATADVTPFQDGPWTFSCDYEINLTAGGIQWAFSGNYLAVMPKLYPKDNGKGHLVNVIMPSLYNKTNSAYPVNTLYLAANSGTNGLVKFSNMKLEPGIVATGWTPAPEDYLPADGAAAKLAHSLKFTGGSTATFDGTADQTVPIPSTLPASGGTADNVSGVVEVEHGGTGATALTSTSGAIAKLFPEYLGSSFEFIPTFTSSFSKVGYSHFGDFKTGLGLNNVDNTHDSQKSVKFATNAGNADTLGGKSASDFAPNDSLIYIGKIGTGDAEGTADHSAVLEKYWSQLPNEKPFVMHLHDYNHTIGIGLLYGDRKYGCILVLGYDGILAVQCTNGTISTRHL